MHDAHESLAVGLQLGDFGFVIGPEFLELDDLLPQPPLAVRYLPALPDLGIELVLEVQVALGERVARELGLLGQCDDRQGSVGVFRHPRQDAVHGGADAASFVQDGGHGVFS
ncbi:hypothetical protein [Streptomyces tremellae]|uniref:hypothetical protein n=1 Tax=Streptomyces tremellae TaxID=1124239 RepID=UPI0031EE0F48